MAKKIERVKWFAILDGQKYGASLIIGREIATNDEIAEIVAIMATQMKQSLQLALTGASDDVLTIDSAEKEYNEKGE